MSIRMKQRAQQALGMNSVKNMAITQSLHKDDTFFVWSWVHRMKQLNKMNNRNKKQMHIFPGIYTILGFDQTQKPAPPFKSPHLPFAMKEGTHEDDPHEPFRIHTSPHRSVALQICGWDEELFAHLPYVMPPPLTPLLAMNNQNVA